jgi:hypothetical protein
LRALWNYKETGGNNLAASDNPALTLQITGRTANLVAS